MADTYTGVLKARKIEPGTRSNTWGTALNADVLDILDAAICGNTTIDILSATTYSLAALVDGTLGEAHFFGITFTGTPASAVTITVPASVTYKTFLIYNNTGQSLTIKYAATGGVVIKNGGRQTIWCDGTTVRAISFGLGVDNTVTGENTYSATQTYTQSGLSTPAIKVSAANANVILEETDAAADNQKWYFQVNGTALQLGVVNDAYSVSANWVYVTRSGAGITAVAFPTTAIGSFLVGTTSSVEGSSIAGFLAPASRNAIAAKAVTAAFFPVVCWNADTSGDNAFAYFGTEGTLTGRGTIDYNRAGGLVRYNTTSDYRSKEVYGPVANAGELIDALKVYRGKMLGATIERQMVIAHEAQAVVPYAVSGYKDQVDEDGQPVMQTVDHSSMVPLLIAEIQALRARVAALESDPR